MLTFVVRRAVSSVVAAFCVVTLIFFVTHLMPADPVMGLVGYGAGEKQIQAMIERMGLNKPLLQQYWNSLCRLVRGDLGVSFRNFGRPIARDLLEYLPPSVELASAAFVIAIPLAVLFGSLSAMRSGSILDAVIRSGALAVTCGPGWWFALLVQILVVRTGSGLPISGYVSTWLARPQVLTGSIILDSILRGDSATLASGIMHLMLPAAVLGLIMTGIFTRLVRASILAVCNHDYVRTARSKGAKESTVLRRHILRNALIPLVTISCVEFGMAIAGGAAVVEVVFGRPGMGFYAATSSLAMDVPAIMALALVASGLVLSFNLLADIACSLVDPRIRYD